MISPKATPRTKKTNLASAWEKNTVVDAPLRGKRNFVKPNAAMQQMHEKIAATLKVKE